MTPERECRLERAAQAFLIAGADLIVELDSAQSTTDAVRVYEAVQDTIAKLQAIEESALAKADALSGKGSR